ncbi:MAG: GldG family protein, partial [Treponema sp.]|nr:GldG family protein [Treponema sp.]
EEQLFEISQDTQNYLAELDRDVNIYVLDTETRFTANSPTQYFIQANEVIRKYSQYSSRIDLEYVDMIRNPDFTSRYPGMSLAVGDILLVSGDRTRALKPQDLFNIQSSYYGSYVSSSKAEQAMTGAVLAITSDTVSVATVIGGHGEWDVSAFTDLLQLNAWELRTCNTMTEAIPTETDLLILAAPERDLSPEELQEIDLFLESRTNRIFFYLGLYTQPPLKNLEAFLAEWGLAVDTGMVFESNENLVLWNNPLLFLAEFIDSDYSRTALEQGLYPVLPQSRPMRILFEGSRYRSTQTLIQSSISSFVRPADADLIDWQPSESDWRPGTPLLAMGTNNRTSVDGDIISSHVLASGSVQAFDQFLLENLNIANSSYFLNLMDSLNKREAKFYVQDKTLGFTQLDITTGLQITLTLIFVILVPLVVLGTGIVVWLRRRHK